VEFELLVLDKVAGKPFAGARNALATSLEYVTACKPADSFDAGSSRLSDFPSLTRPISMHTMVGKRARPTRTNPESVRLCLRK